MENVKKISSLAIFCGSRHGDNPLFGQHALKLVEIMHAHDITLIYGGGRNGLMGVVADGMMRSGGTVKGVIPKRLSEKEHQHDEISELLVVEDMHVRKRTLYEMCDAAIILPGGFGTLDELFEVLTWNQLAIHDKRIFIMNTSGFYDHLIEHIRAMARHGFLYSDVDANITVLQQPEELSEYLS